MYSCNLFSHLTLLPVVLVPTSLAKGVGDTFLATMIRITIWVTVEITTDRYITPLSDQNLAPVQKPVATPSTPKSPNLVSPSNSVPYIVRRTKAAGVSSTLVGTEVIPNPAPTSLLDALRWPSAESDSRLGMS